MSLAVQTQEFAAERRCGLGGSDAKDYLGLDPYGCQRRLFYDKLGHKQDYPVSGQEKYFERGHTLEPIIREKYERETNRTVAPSGHVLFTHEDYPGMIGHIDGEIQGSLKGVFEAKTAAREVFFKMKREGLPQEYVAQLHHYMLVTGLSWGSFAVLWPDGWEFLWFDIEADHGLIEEIAQKAVETWVWILQAKADYRWKWPNSLPPKSRQCQRCPWRHTCQGEALLKGVHSNPGEEIPYDPDLSEVVAEYVELKQIEEEAGELAAAAKKRLEAEIGDRPAVDTDGARVYFRPQVSQRWDMKEFEKKEPATFKALAKKYKKPSASRPLRVYAK